MRVAAESCMPPWSRRSRWYGSSDSIATTVSFGPCFSRLRRFPSGTRSGGPQNSNGNRFEILDVSMKTRVPRYALILSAMVLGMAACLWSPCDASAFCGFYVGGAGASLYNHASQVAMVRNGDRTVISLMNDYEGPL